MKTFSVIIPNYNNAQWLKRMFQSIKKQTFKNYEVIFVDDMSTDNSVAIALEELKSFKSSKLIQNKEKRFNGGSRNAGLDVAKGEYILFIDSDDTFYSEYCFEEIAEIIDEEEPDLIRLPYYYTRNGETKFFPLKERTIEELVNNVNVACWTKCVKREKIVRFAENTLMEDVVQHIKQCDNIKNFAVYEAGVVNWNRDNSNSCSTHNTLQDGKWKSSLYRFYADLLDTKVRNPYCQIRLRQKTLEAYTNIKRDNFVQ